MNQSLCDSAHENGSNGTSLCVLGDGSFSTHTGLSKETVNFCPHFTFTVSDIVYEGKSAIVNVTHFYICQLHYANFFWRNLKLSIMLKDTKEVQQICDPIYSPFSGSPLPADEPSKFLTSILFPDNFTQFQFRL